MGKFNRGKPIKYYSDRIVQLVRNGLLTFIDENTLSNDFFNNKEIIFIKIFWILVISLINIKDKKREKITKNGKKNI